MKKKIKLSLKFSTLKENVLPFNKHVFDLKYSIGSIGQATLPREKDIELSKAEQTNWQNRITGMKQVKRLDRFLGRGEQELPPEGGGRVILTRMGSNSYMAPPLLRLSHLLAQADPGNSPVRSGM